MAVKMRMRPALIAHAKAVACIVLMKHSEMKCHREASTYFGGERLLRASCVALAPALSKLKLRGAVLLSLLS